MQSLKPKVLTLKHTFEIARTSRKVKKKNVLALKVKTQIGLHKDKPDVASQST